MVVNEVIGGRKATVAYMLEDFTPTDPDHATLVKVLFDSGDTVWLTPAPKPKE